MRLQRRVDRSGNYSMLVGFLLPVFLGFTALSVDTSWIAMSESQAQDVADAAAHAALIELRQSGDQTEATAVANNIINNNKVGREHPDLQSLTFGTWARGGAFEATTDRPNAVQATVGRTAGTNGVQLNFARIWGKDEASVQGSATAASRSLHVVLVMDITGSFKNEIHHARNAALAFLDVMSESPGEYDRIGMAVFTYKFSWEWTPMFDLADSTAVTAAETQWGLLNVASKTNLGGTNFSNGGRYPQMPREYSDEPGTDHHVGLVMSREMFLNEVDPFAYRAAVMLTDGSPNGLGNSSIRDGIPYVEDRWNEYAGPTPHSKNDIKDATVAESITNWDDHQIHLWTVSFRVDNAFLDDSTQGDGQYFFTTNAADLTPIFEAIANSLPLLIVQ